jgi:hypothetical protein
LADKFAPLPNEKPLRKNCGGVVEYLTGHFSNPFLEDMKLIANNFRLP